MDADHLYSQAQHPNAEEARSTIDTDAVIDEYVRDRDRAAWTIIRLRVNRLVEMCRRRLEGLTFKSTYNGDRIHALEAVIAKCRAEIGPLITKIEPLMLKIRLAEQDLADYRSAQQRVEAERAAHANTGMYHEPARFVDLLYTVHHVNRGDFASATAEDVAEIASILSSRSHLLSTTRARTELINDAQLYQQN